MRACMYVYMLNFVYVLYGCNVRDAWCVWYERYVCMGCVSCMYLMYVCIYVCNVNGFCVCMYVMRVCLECMYVFVYVM